MNLPHEVVTEPSGSGRRAGASPHIALSGRRLLVVDDEPECRKLLVVMLEQVGMSCTTASNGPEALSILQQKPVDAVIADLNMPTVSGLELLAQVRRFYPQQVFLMATGVDDVRVGMQAMRQGADDYLVKPLEAEMIVTSLERAFHKRRLEQEVESYRQHLEEMVSARTLQLQKALRRIERGYADTLDALGAAIDLRDSQTGGHSRRVLLYSVEMLKALTGTPKQLKSLAMGAWLHDIGKLAIPDAILFKPGPLTGEERKIMETHVRIGYDMVKRISFLADAAEIILTHHERWNGSGYPNGLKGETIPLGARIFAVADTVDAMTSDRPYHSALPFQTARDEIERKAGILFDPEVAGVFLSIPKQTWEAIRKPTAATETNGVLAGISIENSLDAAELQSNDVE
ncbi:MAG TPA: HD domain-containing phosphohydrolase [Candidatus Dormibacteraeota bacterium]|nr:HD domain-containing phosphohydrolase [Candidatus Dormibacteraeota bacterium]